MRAVADQPFPRVRLTASVDVRVAHTDYARCIGLLLSHYDEVTGEITEYRLVPVRGEESPLRQPGDETAIFPRESDAIAFLTKMAEAFARIGILPVRHEAELRRIERHLADMRHLAFKGKPPA